MYLATSPSPNDRLILSSHTPCRPRAIAVLGRVNYAHRGVFTNIYVDSIIVPQ